MPLKGMDRRTLVKLAAALPALVATPAYACSPVLKSPRSSGLQNQQIRKLFEAWWGRDDVAFRNVFTQTLMADGTRMESTLASDLLAQNPIYPEALDIFPHFFTDSSKIKRLKLIVNTDAGVFVACAERDLTENVTSDCQGMPTLLLFLVKMYGLNPRSVIHLASVNTVEVDKFSIWSEG